MKGREFGYYSASNGSWTLYYRFPVGLDRGEFYSDGRGDWCNASGMRGEMDRRSCLLELALRGVPG